MANPTLKVCAWLTNFQPPLVPPSPEFMAPAVDSNPSLPISTDVAGTSSISGTEIPTSTPTEDCTLDTEYHTDDEVVCLYMEESDYDDIDFRTFSDFEHDH